MAVTRVLFRRPFLRATLGLIWMMLQGKMALDSWATGFLMATLALWLFGLPDQPMAELKIDGPLGVFRWLISLVKLIGIFLYELVLSVWGVALLTVKRRIELTPGIIAMDLRDTSTGRLALISALITLTPGTLVLGHTPDNRTIYVHCIDASDEEGAMRSCRLFETLVMEVLR
jgi:multicomponent Na+:H+ antiporter subunit E